MAGSSVVEQQIVNLPVEGSIPSLPAKKPRMNSRFRPDGSIYITSPDLPGLHVVVEKGDDPLAVMEAVLKDFLPLYEAAVKK